MNTEITPSTSTSTILSPAAIILLEKKLKDMKEQAREEICVGEHAIHALVGLELIGTVKVGADYSQRITQKASPWGIVAVLLEELQEKLAAAGDIGLDLDKLVERAMSADPALTKQIQERADKIVAALKEETRQICKGKVTCNGIVEVISVEPVKAALQ